MEQLSPEVQKVGQSKDTDGKRECANEDVDQLPAQDSFEAKFRISRNLLVILSEYLPADGRCTPGSQHELDAELLAFLKVEIDHVLETYSTNSQSANPSQWSNPLATNIPVTSSSTLFFSQQPPSAAYFCLKIHQIISQLIVSQSDRHQFCERTNNYETSTLLSQIYSSSPDCRVAISRNRRCQPDSDEMSKFQDSELYRIISASANNILPEYQLFVVLKKDIWENSCTEPRIYSKNGRSAANEEENKHDQQGTIAAKSIVSESQVMEILVDEGHLAMAVSTLGRFDLYLLASVAECMRGIIMLYECLTLPKFLLCNDTMVVSRAQHARRVYKDAINTYLITAAKFNWYVALLTSGSLRAVQDTFVDFSQDIWHSQFNRRFDLESAERLESLMITLLGHNHDMVRSQASVCLNNLIDNHDWQQEVPFLPILKRCGDLHEIVVHVTDSSEQPDDVFLISMAPSRYQTDYIYTYHTLEWEQLDRNQSKLASFNRVWQGTCKMGKFEKCGFYDWRLIRVDPHSGSWRPVQATLDSLQRLCTGSYSLANFLSEDDLEFKSRNLWPELGRLKEAQEATGYSHFKTLPIQGRFIVLPKSTNYMNLHEINVDLCGAVFRAPSTSGLKTTTDLLEERGSFAKVSERLDSLKVHGVNALFLTGCQARNYGNVSYGPNGQVEFDDEDASPYAVTCRASVCEILGGRARLDDLVRDSRRRAVSLLVEFQSRVSVCGAHRKYNNLTLTCVDSQGHQKPLEGGQGKYYNIDESSELNYRCKRSWDLYVEDVLEWLNRCDGIRLDCAHLLPRIYEADEHELSRTDPDGLMHYTSLEKLLAPIVVPTNKDCGFWNSTAAVSHWPNPFLVRVCKAAWQSHPNAVLIGDCGLLPEGEENKIGIVSRSGLIPFVQSMPSVLMQIFGIHYDETEQSMQSVPPVEPSECIGSWYEKIHASLPEGCVVVQSSTTAQSPYPTLLYRRGAWPAADLLQLCTDIPCTIMGEDEGQCLRRGVANVNKRDDGTLNKELTADSRVDSSVVFARARSVARFENPQDVDTLERQYVNEFSPTSGQDIKQISAHYKHRREFRRRYQILSDTPMMPVKTHDASGKILQRVFASCRIDNLNNVAIIGTNFGEEACPHVEVNISFLNKVLSARRPASGALVESWNLFEVDTGTYDPKQSNWLLPEERRLKYVRDNSIGLMSLAELLSFPHTFAIDSYQSSGLGMKVLDKEAVPHTGELASCLYLSALRRLSVLASKIGQQQTAVDNRAQSKTDARLRFAIQANYIIQSLSTCIRSSESLDDLALVLMRITGAWTWHNEVCAESPLPSLASLLNVVDFLSSDKNLTATFFAKVKKIIAGIEDTNDGAMALDKKTLGMRALREVCLELEAMQSLSPIVFITSELGKWSTVGGLGVMIDELSQTIASDIGYECIVMCPYYHVNRQGQNDYMKEDGILWKMNIEITIGPHENCVFGVHVGEYKNVKMIFLHNEAIWHHPYPDNSPADAVRMLVAFGKAFLEALCQLHIFPQLILTNDWATGLIPAYAKNGQFGNTFDGTTFFHIIHNFDSAYEGRIYPPAGQDFTWLHGLPRDSLIDPLWATPILNPSRCVLLHCDQWGTVSPSYRDELRGANGASGSSPLSYLLNMHPRPFAVCNGVPVKPRKERIAALPFKTHEAAKAELQKKYFGFTQPDLSIPLFSFIGRVTVQKGVHMILESAESIIQRYNNRVQILVGGPVTWRDPYSARCGNMMLSLRAKFPWAFYSAPNEFFSDGTLVNVGSDFGLMPSLFEPGGIVQHEFFIAGTPVIAYNTGGLKDTVHEFNLETNQGNGFNFASYNVGDYIYAVERAMRVFSDPEKYRVLRKNAEASVYTCEESAREWCREFCRLRHKTMINPRTIKSISATLPPFTLDEESTLRDHLELITGPSATMSASSSPDLKNLARTPETTTVCQFRVYYPRHSRSVAVTGSYDDWKSRRALHWDNALGCFSIDLALKKGEHIFKFIVDGAWICSDYHQKKLDGEKIENNYIVV